MAIIERSGVIDPLTVSKIIGGRETTSGLILQTTSDVGATGADMHFLVGNNGATEAMTILNNGKVGIGTASPSATFQIKSGANGMFSVQDMGTAVRITIGGTGTSNALTFDSYSDRSISGVDYIGFNATNETHRIISGRQYIGSANGINLGPNSNWSSNHYGIRIRELDASNAGNILAVEDNDGTNYFNVRYNGLVGIGQTSPTAVLHLKAGTALANTAPLKFTSGTLLTTPEAGAVEFLTDAFYGTITTGAARKTFAFLENPVFATPIRLKGYTVVTLPAGIQGDTAFVTDALAPTYLGALTGGGAVVTPVFYNGNAWVSY